MSGDVTQKHLCVHGYDREKERESKPLTIPPQPPWIVLYPGQCAKEKGPVISGNIPICAESAVLIFWYTNRVCPLAISVGMTLQPCILISVNITLIIH